MATEPGHGREPRNRGFDGTPTNRSLDSYIQNDATKEVITMFQNVSLILDPFTRSMRGVLGRRRT
ncbi:hypothetical protein BRC81_05495 [Halobacteriales archaeon QS_1_68_20]|nr:MAG: hypothetical protein BRC81_05495 [Halobacteriales archaeon QS_1_68_20]